MNPDRLPPHDLAAEQGVLGCLLLDAQGLAGAATGEAMEECLRQRLEPRHFYDLRHQLIFGAIQRMTAGAETRILPGLAP